MGGTKMKVYSYINYYNLKFDRQILGLGSTFRFAESSCNAQDKFLGDDPSIENIWKNTDVYIFTPGYQILINLLCR